MNSCNQFSIWIVSCLHSFRFNSSDGWFHFIHSFELIFLFFQRRISHINRNASFKTRKKMKELIFSLGQSNFYRFVWFCGKFSHHIRRQTLTQTHTYTIWIVTNHMIKKYCLLEIEKWMQCNLIATVFVAFVVLINEAIWICGSIRMGDLHEQILIQNTV